MSSEHNLKFGIVGLAGSGKTTFLVLLSGIYATPDSIIDVTRYIEQEELSNLLKRFAFVGANISGKYSLNFLLGIIENFWMQGKGTPKTVAKGVLREIQMSVRVPKYRTRNDSVQVNLVFPDPSGESIPILKTVLEEIDVGLDHREIRNIAIEKLRTLARNGNKYAGDILPFLEPTDYDGFFVLIDPSQSSRYASQALLYALLKLLIPNQSKNKITLTILFSKSLMRKKINSRDVLSDQIYLDKYLDATFVNAFNLLVSKYNLVFSLIRNYGCGRRAKLNFAGAFFYDAFLSMSEAPDFEIQEDEKVLKSLNAILPLIHTVHVHLPGWDTPIQDKYSIIKNQIC